MYRYTIYSAVHCIPVLSENLVINLCHKSNQNVLWTQQSITLHVETILCKHFYIFHQGSNIQTRFTLQYFVSTGESEMLIPIFKVVYVTSWFLKKASKLFMSIKTSIKKKAMQNANVCSPLSRFETKVWMSSYSQSFHRLWFIYNATYLGWIQSLWSRNKV